MSTAALTRSQLKDAIAEKAGEFAELINEVYARKIEAEQAETQRAFEMLVQSAYGILPDDPQDEFPHEQFKAAIDAGAFGPLIVESTETWGEGIEALDVPLKDAEAPAFPETMSVREAAEAIGVTTQTVRSLVKSGRLKTKGKVRQGKATKITEASVSREYRRRAKKAQA